MSKIHRFYAPDIKLERDFWLHNKDLLRQWNRVLRFKPGGELVLFSGHGEDRLYKIVEISSEQAHLQLVTELASKLPKHHIYLFWSLLKSDKNDLVLQKCSELGVTNFVPVISERSIRKDFNITRARKIIIEASEQCGRSDIPAVRDPIKLATAIEEYKGKVKLYVGDEAGGQGETQADRIEPIGILIGPEGGWSMGEQKIFEANKIIPINIGDFTLRAETAAIISISKLV